MAVEGANWFSGLNEASPSGAGPISEGDDEFRQLKRCILNQFTNLGDIAATMTAQQLNAMNDYNVAGKGQVEARFQSLENLTFVTNAPANALDFNNAWWNADYATEPRRWFLLAGRRDAFSNTPWPWGSDIVSGQADTLTCVIDRLVAPGDAAAMNRVLKIDPQVSFAINYLRAGAQRSQLISNPWTWIESTILSSTLGTSGDRIGPSTVCATIYDLCPDGTPFP